MFDRGSEWARWDPHIHTPDTALEDRFSGDWEAYFQLIEASDPAPVGLGITDYLSVDNYVEFRARARDRPGFTVPFVFPNVEFRLAPHTSSARPINAHLLISPEDPEHVDRIQECLTALSFTLPDIDSFKCDRTGLVRLGRTHVGRDDLEEAAAYRAGVGQFKIDHTAFIDWYYKHPWLLQNSLLVIAGGKDGLAGVRRDTGFGVYHTAMLRQIDAIFSGYPADREYFLGQGVDDVDTLNSRYGGLRPCLHGCDAHGLDRVLQVDLDRLCWIKASPTFDGLRQVIHEPEARVWLGASPPQRPDPERIIESLTIDNHGGWFSSNEIGLSPYLTAIIGERGSGKTALADLVALACGAWLPDTSSFLDKAGGALADTVVAARWRSGRQQDAVRIGAYVPSVDPAVRYLSQQFVERLCSRDIMADSLIAEVERVVFEHLDEPARLHCSDFAELRAAKTAHMAAERDELRQRIGSLSGHIEGLFNEVQTLEKKRADLERFKSESRRLTGEVQKLTSNADAKSAALVQKRQDALDGLEKDAATIKARQQHLATLESRVARTQTRLNEHFGGMKELLADAGIAPEFHARFQLRFEGDVATPIAERKVVEQESLTKLLGDDLETPPRSTVAGSKSALAAAQKALKLDEQRRSRLLLLNKEKSKAEAGAAKLVSQITATTTRQRDELPEARRVRNSAYLRYFALLEEEKQVLEELYAPLRRDLESRGTTESELEFEVGTDVDTDSWAARGEAMFDMRVAGHAYTQRGALLQDARDHLEGPWKSGDQVEIRRGIAHVQKQLMGEDSRIPLRSDHKPRDIADWLFGVDHIRIRYDLRYRGTALQFLSPGTRGIVLLILYLAIDSQDDRPLVIDQPEENLDNASVYKLLVDYFRQAKTRRQIIVVTHNPNLVVNTDAELVIVAQAKRRSNGLPSISYRSGPLESLGDSAVPIRELACQLLEGGRAAFSRRERRYRLGERAKRLSKGA